MDEEHTFLAQMELLFSLPSSILPAGDCVWKSVILEISHARNVAIVAVRVQERHVWKLCCSRVIL